MVVKEDFKPWINLGWLGLDRITFEETQNIFKEGLEETLGKNGKFKDYSPIYPFATENLSGYMPKLDFAGKKVLTVSGSGDHIINPYFFGAESVTAFDSNLLSALFSELKIAALKRLSFIEFKTFFLLQSNPNPFGFETYQQLRGDISDLCRSFFDRGFETYGFDGQKFRQSKLFNNDYDTTELRIRNNPYLASQESFVTARENTKPTKSLVRDITRLDWGLPDKNYDIMLFSNIADYAMLMFPGRQDYLDLFCQHMKIFSSHLSTKGTICAAYVYDARTEDSKEGEAYRTDIDRPEVRRNLFGSLGMRYEEIRFPGVINDLRDGVVLLKK